jgi:hypothetical protein
MLTLLLTLLALAAYLIWSGLPAATAFLACALVMMALLQFRLRSRPALLWLAVLSLLGVAEHYLPLAVARVPALAGVAPLLPWLQLGIGGAAIGYALGVAWAHRKAGSRPEPHTPAGS